MSAGCVIPYIRDTIRRTTTPHRASWFAFSLMSSLAAVVQLRGGLAAGALLSLGGAVGFTSVFLLSLRFGVGGTTTPSRLQIIGTIVAGVAWVITDNAVLGVLLVCGIEAIAIIPTVRKAYHLPTSETLSTWIVDGGSGMLAAVSAVSNAELIYPVSHVIVNAAVIGAIAAGRRHLHA
jgi:hypothetical protein